MVTLVLHAKFHKLFIKLTRKVRRICRTFTLSVSLQVAKISSISLIVFSLFCLFDIVIFTWYSALILALKTCIEGCVIKFTLINEQFSLAARIRWLRLKKSSPKLRTPNKISVILKDRSVTLHFFTKPRAKRFPKSIRYITM